MAVGSGLQNGESIGTVNIASLGLPATAGVAGSPYAITAVSGATGGTFNTANYTITYNPLGTITVNPAALSLTSTSQTKTFGTTLPATTTFFTSSGLLNGDTVGTVDIVSAGLPGSASVAGSPYPITAVSNAAGGTFIPTNYAITYVPAGTITVTPAGIALTITSLSQTKTYGTALSPTTTFFTATGLQGGDTIGTVDITSAGLVANAPVSGSPYPITNVFNASGGTFNPNNYTINYVPAGNITVNPAPLSINSVSQIKNYGVTLPSTTTFFTSTGLQNGESIGTVDIASLGLPATAGVAGSPYAITNVSNATGGTFNSSNYAITYNPLGTITVNPAPLTITPDSQVKTYGTTLPSTTNLFTPVGLHLKCARHGRFDHRFHHGHAARCPCPASVEQHQHHCRYGYRSRPVQHAAMNTACRRAPWRYRRPLHPRGPAAQGPQPFHAHPRRLVAAHRRGD